MQHKKDRFDLEHDIQQCWAITDDLEMVMERLLDSSAFEGMPPLLADKTANLLLGLRELYGMRFERLWQTFEFMVRDGQIGRGLVDDTVDQK